MDINNIGMWLTLYTGLDQPKLYSTMETPEVNAYLVKDKTQGTHWESKKKLMIFG